MSFEATSNPGSTAGLPARAYDFSHRAYLDERMDGPCSFEEFRGCLHDLAQCNMVTLGHRPVLQWLKQFANNPHNGQPLHIVDVGCGGGDTLRHIERWARRHKLAIRLTGIDLNPFAARVARELTPDGSQI